jgi:hypothetical protein
MKLKLIYAIVLSFVFVLSSCGPAGETPQMESSNADPQPVATESPLKSEQSPVTSEPPTASEETPLPAEEVPPPAPTSRGPDLEATDPATVTLASGNLQLIEFFRFT